MPHLLISLLGIRQPVQDLLTLVFPSLLSHALVLSFRNLSLKNDPLVQIKFSVSGYFERLRGRGLA